MSPAEVFVASVTVAIAALGIASMLAAVMSPGAGSIPTDRPTDRSPE